MVWRWFCTSVYKYTKGQVYFTYKKSSVYRDSSVLKIYLYVYITVCHKTNGVHDALKAHSCALSKFRFQQQKLQVNWGA